jgi:hypothetical protein
LDYDIVIVVTDREAEVTELSNLQENQLWIGVAFTLILVGFLIYAFNKAQNLSAGQHTILKFLASLCAAFAGAAIAGSALFNLHRVEGGTDLAISGTAGFALFFVVWIFFPKPPETPSYPDGFNFSVPTGWTFQETVDAIVGRDRAFVKYTGFRPEELKAKLKRWEISCPSALDAVKQVGTLAAAGPDTIRDYIVTLENSTYIITIK